MRHRLAAATVIGLITFPALTAVAALAAYLVSPVNASPALGRTSFILGGLIGLGFALLVGGVSFIFLTPARANPYEYRELNNRLCSVMVELKRLAGNPRASEATACAPNGAIAFSERGLIWAGGHGYLSLWTQIHQVEEALFMVEDNDWLVAEGFHDLLRLQGSKVPKADALIADIKAAVTALFPTAQQHYLGGETAGSPFAVEAARWDNLARMKLRQVRTALNAYRQSLWDGLVRARNQFVRTLVLTTFLTAVAVDLIVLRGTDKRMVFAATVLALIGVVVGLFARLGGLTSSTSAEEDFGLDSAHLVAAPILSGIAAVVGVLLVSLLKLKIGDVDIGAPTVNPNESVLRATFNLGTNPGGLIIAALFGLTPELLIRYLRSQADTFSKGLSTSEVWGKSAATAVP